MTTEWLNAGRMDANGHRQYPFSESASTTDARGDVLQNNVFLDAMIYPITTSFGKFRLYKIDFASQEAQIYFGELDLTNWDLSDPDEIQSLENTDSFSRFLLKGSCKDSRIELHDWMGRHAGVLVCGDGWNQAFLTSVTRMFSELEFSSAVCCPLSPAGLTSVSDSFGAVARGRKIVLKGDGFISPVLRRSETGEFFLSFDLRTTDPVSDDEDPPLRLLFIHGAGLRAFNLYKLSDGSVAVGTPDLSREDIRNFNMREVHMSVATEVEFCNPSEEKTCYISFERERETQSEVLSQSNSGNVNLVTDDFLGAVNSLQITLVDGQPLPVNPKYTGDSKENASSAVARLLSSPETHGNGIRISMPGISGMTFNWKKQF